MTRRSATFKEVSISLHSASRDTESSSKSILHDTDSIDQLSTYSAISSKNLIKSSPSKMAMKFHFKAGQAICTHSAMANDNSDSTGNESVPPTVPEESNKSKSPFKSPLARLWKASKSLTNPKSPAKEKKTPHRPSHAVIKRRKEAAAQRMQARIKEWEIHFLRAVELDKNGDITGAYDAYRSFNRLVTREAINYFEQLTNDQQKLLNDLMLVMDKRIKKLKIALALHTSPAVSFGSETNEEDTTLRDLQNCFNIFETIKIIGCRSKMPVVLIYRERHHRNRHKDQRKGKSNRIVFPKEKRDFLQMIGLPGKMITKDGIDFSVKPEPELQEGYVNPDPNEEKLASLEITSSGNIKMDDNGSIYGSEDTGNEDDEKVNLVNCLGTQPPGIQKQKHNLVKNYSNHYKSEDTITGEGFSNSFDSDDVETKSMLSCDSCSSTDSENSDFDGECPNDTEVYGNYVHEESVKPPPFYQEERTYITLALEKVGVKNTSRLSPAFLRISIRDPEGKLLAKEQETNTWDVINKHYLRSPGPIFIEESLESMNDDSAIFFEVRHFIKGKTKVSTLCYTFIEKTDIQTGEFICELYKPPVQLKRTNLVPYSNKAFFLHMDIKIENVIESEPTESVSTSEISEYCEAVETTDAMGSSNTLDQ